MRSWIAQVSLFAVALLIGVLLIGQLRSQARPTEISSLSAQELSQLVDQLSQRNRELRTALTDLHETVRQYGEAGTQGQSAIDVTREDLRRVSAFGGLAPVEGQGIVLTVNGDLDAIALNDLLNELRNAGAEAITVDGVRVVTGIVVAGAPGELSVENHAIGDGFEIRAIGSPQILTGTLTRTGGVIAQVGNAYADARLTVTPLDSMTLPASDRTQAPVYAKPRL